MNESQIVCDIPSDNLLDVDQALSKLEVEFPEKAQLIKLRYFAGLTLDQAAAADKARSA